MEPPPVYKRAVRDSHPGFAVDTQQATVWFDHIVIATSYIGPLTPVARGRADRQLM